MMKARKLLSIPEMGILLPLLGFALIFLSIDHTFLNPKQRDASMKKSVVTFGELLLRLVTRGYERFVQSEWGVARYTGGDAFTGGLIYTMMSGCLRRKAIEFAAAAGCLKHSIPCKENGDGN